MLRSIRYLSFIIVVALALPAFAQAPKTVLILTSSYGAGHDSAARAIATMIKNRDASVNVITKDYADFVPFNLKGPTQKGYETLTRVSPRLWDEMFNFSMWQARHYTRASQIFTPIRKNDFLQYLKDVRPDVVISTYFFATASLDSFREQGLLTRQNFPFLWVHTDNVDENYFTVLSKEADMTVLPHPIFTKLWIEHGIPADKVATTGMPVNPKLFEPFTAEDRTDFMKSVGLDPGVRTITIAGGSAGVGNYPLMVKSLVSHARGPIQIVALCANNTKNFEILSKMHLPQGVKLIVEKKVPNEKLISYVRSSNGYIVKSGGLSSAESAVMGVPTILLDIMGGPEKYNSKFFADSGMALVTKDQSKVGEMMMNLLDDPAKLVAMRAAQQELKNNITMDPIEKFIFGDVQKSGPSPVGSREPTPKKEEKIDSSECAQALAI